MKFTKKQIERYSRQIILKKIGVFGQKKLLKSNVLIVGAGGLGSPIAIYLAALGLGKIGIVDNDSVKLSNLSRQIIFSTNDLMKKKSDVAINRLRKINPDIKLKSYKNRLNKNNIDKIAKKFSIVVDGSDNFRTRFLINDQSLKQKKVLISAAVSGFEGHIFKFDFRRKTPCYRCFMPEDPEQHNNCDSLGVTPTITGIIGTLQANEVLNSILNFKSNMEKKLIIFNSIKMSFRKVNLSRNNNCKNKC